MKTTTSLSIISIVLLAFISCKGKKNAMTTSSSTATTLSSYSTAGSPSTTTTVANPSSGTTDKVEEQYRFVVSFYSIGQGIDGKVHQTFVDFLTTYPKKISFESTHWGREGEVDYCLALNEISASEQMDFVKKAKEILSKSTLIHIKENTVCENKGKWPGIQTIVESGENIYRFVVSFYSIGEGIDLKVHETFEKFLSSYPKKIAYEPTHWGREGEVDYCLLLSELSASEQTEFIKKANEILDKSNKVHINENAKCVNKR